MHLFQRWENAGPTWPQALAILRHRACFIEILERHLPEQEGRNRSIAALWDHFAELATLLMQADVSITEEAWHGIEKFATFALEAKHAENKARYNRSTNKARHCLVTAAKQQLEGHIRQQLHDPSWAQSALDLSPRLAAFVRSSTHVAE